MQIVMVCTGNTCRSPMAEALMRRALEECGVEGVGVRSAGVSALGGSPVSLEAVIEMRARGLDIEPHRARPVADVSLSGALVLCMTGAHAARLRRIAPDADIHVLMDFAGFHGDIDDPLGQGPEAYKRAADQIWQAVQIIAARIAARKE